MKIELTPRRLIEGVTMKYYESADVYCPRCNEGGMTGVVFDGDQPPQDEALEAVCHSCGHEFIIHWTIHPEWYVGEPY